VIAAAGMQDGDLDIQIEREVLTISAGRRNKTAAEVEYLHQGIAQRAFKLSFRLADFIEVRGASLENGLLNVELVRRVRKLPSHAASRSVRPR
jgi:molecular chaperone IbpA